MAGGSLPRGGPEPDGRCRGRVGAQHAQHLDVTCEPVERVCDIRGRCHVPRGRRRTCSARGPSLRGRDSIRVRLTSRPANSDRHSTSHPGASDPTPQNTIAVFHGPWTGPASVRAARVGADGGEPHEPRLVARRHPRRRRAGRRTRTARPRADCRAPPRARRARRPSAPPRRSSCRRARARPAVGRG